MDEIIEMNTGEGVSNWTTNWINGELKSFILISEDVIDVSIESEYGYNLFKKMGHVGVQNYLVRLPSQSPEGGVYANHVDCINLNERLIINISGKKGISIKIVIRYC